MGLFGRKAKGRHALGAAVTSIPSGPPAVAVAAPVYAPPAAPVAPVYEEPVAPSFSSTTAGAVAQLLVTGEWEAVADAPAAAPPAVPEQYLPTSSPSIPAQPLSVVGERPSAVLSAEGFPGAATVAPPVSAPSCIEAPQPSAPLAPMTPAYSPGPAAPPVPAPQHLAAAVPHLAPQPVPVAVTRAPAPPVPEPVVAPAPTPVVAVRPPAPPAPRTAPARSSLEAALAELLPTQQPAAAEVPSPSRVQLGFRDGSSTPLDPRSDQFAQLEALAQSLTQRD